jgi:hypothetical protein
MNDHDRQACYYAATDRDTATKHGPYDDTNPTSTKEPSTMKNVDIDIFTRPEDTPIRGNAIASGDDEADEAYALEIEAQIEAGNPWAWTIIEVRATHRPTGLTASAYLGGCSYPDEAAFKAGGYYDDMQQEALAELAALAQQIVEDCDE